MFLVELEANEPRLALRLMGHERVLADEERLVQLDVGGEAGIGRVQVERTGQLVAVERQAGLDAQAVARRPGRTA